MPAKKNLPNSTLYHLRHDFGMTYQAIALMFDVHLATIAKKINPKSVKKSRCVDCGVPVCARSTRCRNCNGKVKPGRFRGGENNINYNKRESHPNWIGDDVEGTCVCGKVFLTRPYMRRTHCSTECYREHRKPQPKMINCVGCGATFEFCRVQKGRAPRRFCTWRCFSKWYRGPNAGLWKDGSSFEPYNPSFHKPLRIAIRERDHDTCAICRFFGNNVHHINYDKKNSDQSNLITLCFRCHGKTNSNRSYWQSKLSNILRARGHSPLSYTGEKNDQALSQR